MEKKKNYQQKHMNKLQCDNLDGENMWITMIEEEYNQLRGEVERKMRGSSSINSKLRIV